MTLLDLNRYQLNSEEKSTFHYEFKLIMSNVILENIKLNSPALKMLSNVPGVYFWMMRIGINSYKIYAGKTNSLPRRLRDYKNEFQEHSPNDYKLRFFQNFIIEHHSDAEFDLYFLTADGHTQKENEVVRKYCPLINEKARVSEADRTVMKDAFEEYYKSIFKSKLSKTTELPVNTSSQTSEKAALPLKQKNGIAMTNHEMIAAAVKEYRGKILETREIKKIVLEAFPNFNLGSLLPNDHGFGNKNPCSCAGTESRIFDRVEPKKYFVR